MTGNPLQREDRPGAGVTRSARVARGWAVPHQPTFREGAQPVPRLWGDISDARVLALLGDLRGADNGRHFQHLPVDRNRPAVATRPRAATSCCCGGDDSPPVLVHGSLAASGPRIQLAAELHGGRTRHLPDGRQMSIVEAAATYAAEGVPLVILAGAKYGSGSSLARATIGILALGVRAVLATSFDPDHRVQLIGLGVLPLQFRPGESIDTLRLTGEETFAIGGLTGRRTIPEQVPIRAALHGRAREFCAIVRTDSPAEATWQTIRTTGACSPPAEATQSIALPGRLSRPAKEVTRSGRQP